MRNLTERRTGGPKASFWFRLQVIVSVGAVAALLVPLFLTGTPWPAAARDHLERFGLPESGAINTVSAIYLGYRAFDTLGETIVLLVAVSGTIGIIAYTGTALTKGFGRQFAAPPANHTAALKTPDTGKPSIRKLPGQRRTALLEVVTAKLGPIVLVFGVYVMLFGHLSPGGGFQGGVVVASGIVFLALGGRADTARRLTEAPQLARLEAAAFLLLVAAAASGIVLGGGFFANTLIRTGVPEVSFIILLNVVIGLKVGAGIGFMCIAMLGKVEES